MSEDEFWGITPRAFFNAVEGFESKRRLEMEVQRLQTLYFVNTWASKPIRDPKKLWSIPGEIVMISSERKRELAHRAMRKAEKFDRIEKRHGNK